MATKSTKSRAIPADALPKKKASGRPSAYRAEFCLLARNLTLIELTIEELGQAMNVATSPINLWIKTHKPFSEAITHARVHADAQVAASLFDQAIGYEYVGIEAFKMKDEKTGAERVDLIPVPKYVPKNVVAARHWLHNRQRSRCKAVPAEVISDTENEPITFIIFQVADASKPKPDTNGAEEVTNADCL